MVAEIAVVVCRWMRQQRGASTIEYALLLALVAAIGMIAVDATGESVQVAFHRLSDEMSPTDRPHDAPIALSPERSSPQIQAPWADPRSWRDPLALATIICVSISLVACRRSSQKIEKPALEDEEPAQRDTTGPLFDKRQKIFRFLSSNTQAMFNSQLEVRHVMTSQLKTVVASTPCAEIQAMFRDQGIHHALVCDSQQRFVGVISDRDILSRRGRTAGDIMTPKPLRVAPDAPLSAALTLMLNHRISCVPVVDRERLCGVYTTTDVILALQCTMQALERVSMIGRGETDPEVELECTLQMLSKLVDQPAEA